MGILAAIRLRRMGTNSGKVSKILKTLAYVQTKNNIVVKILSVQQHLLINICTLTKKFSL
jgi:hypothetical protein